MTKRRNPIIFARTETSHIPRNFQRNRKPDELQNYVYSAQDDGSLRQTPTPFREEEESDSLILDEEPISVCYYLAVLF